MQNLCYNEFAIYRRLIRRDNMPICFFIGHREAPDTLLDKFSAVVERHITEYGVTEFVVGKYGRFDALAAKCSK